jgi:hypothetical protein
MKKRNKKHARTLSTTEGNIQRNLRVKRNTVCHQKTIFSMHTGMKVNKHFVYGTCTKGLQFKPNLLPRKIYIKSAYYLETPN